MSRYAYEDTCPVCGRTIKRRPVEMTGRPCSDCGERFVSPQDRYRLCNARLTDASYTAIIERARRGYEQWAQSSSASSRSSAQADT